MFFVGAVHNWLAALVFLVAHKKIFDLFGMEPMNYPVIMQLFMGLAIVLGIGYFWVGLNIDQNHDIVRLGVIGKITVVVLLTWHWFIGNIPVHIVLCASGDAIFSVLYIEFLLNFAKTQEANEEGRGQS
jgi:hypothetical protein